MKDRIFISKSKSGGGGKSFLVFLMFLAVFVLGVFVGTKLGSFNIKIVKEEIKKEEIVKDQIKKKEIVKDQAGINDTQNKVSDARTDNQKVADESSPVVTPEISPETSPEPPKVAEFTLQLAAFKGSEKAQGLVDELRKKGYYAYITPVRNSNGETWHLIRMGKFKTREEAQDFAALFQEREKMEAYVKEVDQDALLKEIGQ